MKSIPVHEESQVGGARRTVLQAAEAIDLDEEAIERLAIVVTEACTNLVRYATNGEILVDACRKGGKAWVTVAAVDDGPGIANVEAAMVDGYSTAEEGRRGIGGGLGSIRRQANLFDIHSGPNGTSVVATTGTFPGRRSGHYDIAGIIVPKPGFEKGGDGYAVRIGKRATTVVLMDVLGHGPNAAQDAETGLNAFREAKSNSLESLERAMSEALEGSRGAAALLVELPHAPGTLRAVGLGNVRGEILTADGTRYGIPSQPGIMGASAKAPRITEHDWPQDATLILSTDGLKSSPRVPEPSSLFFRSAGIIASSLYKLKRRGSDDAGIVVVRPQA